MEADPAFTEATPVRVHDPHGALAGLDRLKGLVPGPEREGKLELESRPPVKVAKRSVMKAVRWYTEPYQERSDEFHHQLLRVLERMARADERAEKAAGLLAAEMASLRDEVRDLHRALGRAQMGKVAHAAAPGARGDEGGGASGPSSFDYAGFEDRHRGSTEKVRQSLQPYLRWFRGVDHPVLDVGCGRGEFLQLLS